MLTFEAGVCCQVFRQELSLVLHLASNWSAVVGAGVLVIHLGATHDDPSQEFAVDLAVDPTTNGNAQNHLIALASYLTRNLSIEYVVTLEADRVRVEWFGLPHL